MSAATNGSGAASALDESRHHLRVIHEIPGRLRARWPMLRNLPLELRADLEDRIATHPGVLAVELRPLTGSILVDHDPEHLGPRGALELLRDACGVRLVLGLEDDAPAPAQRPPGAGEPTRLALAAARFFDQLSDDVRAATDGRADLATLVPLSFFTLGVLEVAATREVPAPPWWSLCWWSFRSFLSLNEPAIEQVEGE